MLATGRQKEIEKTRSNDDDNNDDDELFLWYG